MWYISFFVVLLKWPKRGNLQSTGLGSWCETVQPIMSGDTRQPEDEAVAHIWTDGEAERGQEVGPGQRPQGSPPATNFLILPEGSITSENRLPAGEQAHKCMSL